ncbi:MAG: bacillithiol system redox-active protein YtxJ [Lutibacter sp.]|nr:bacillithiol system redox-active protein YtxJ [Lutibacter sp.]MDT8416609.1 bacillithiol system redox-active protein YtxJ [Lutibacter sp.]
MGLFDNFLKSADKAESSVKIKWMPLSDKSQLEDIIKISSNKPVLIFKHSTRCGISRMVLKNFESDYDIPETEVDLYFLDLLNYRSLSQDVSTTFKVVHQSPQVLVIKNKKSVYDNSHHSITIEAIKEIIAQ